MPGICLALMGRGRVPEAGEVIEGERLDLVFGSLRRAFAVVERVRDRERWAAIAERPRQDLLVYLPLVRFDGRPRFADLGAAVLAAKGLRLAGHRLLGRS